VAEEGRKASSWHEKAADQDLPGSSWDRLDLAAMMGQSEQAPYRSMFKGCGELGKVVFEAECRAKQSTFVCAPLKRRPKDPPTTIV
jgi:hypothetical protein